MLHHRAIGHAVPQQARCAATHSNSTIARRIDASSAWRGSRGIAQISLSNIHCAVRIERHVALQAASASRKVFHGPPSITIFGRDGSPVRT